MSKRSEPRPARSAEPRPVEPTAPAVPPPVEVPGPEVRAPEPEPTVAAKPSVHLDTGQVTLAFLDTHGRNVPRAELGFGTYELVAAFDPAQPAQVSRVGSVTLTPGEDVAIRCVRSLRRCIVRSGP